MEATVLCHFSWIWSRMPKILWNNKSPISLKRVEWFCSFLRVVICILLDVHWSYKSMLFWFDIVRHRLLVYQNVTCVTLKLESYMRYQVDFLLLLKLQKICYFGLNPKIFLANQFPGFFTYYLFDLLILCRRSIATLNLLIIAAVEKF